MTGPIRVLLVVTPALFRHSLAAVLGRRRHIEVIGEAATGVDAIREAQAARPDVVVVDPEVPGGGSKLVADLCQETTGGALLVLTQATEDGLVGKALEAGARGYLDKHCEIDDLVRSIERVHLGELVVAPSVAEAAVKDLARGQSREPATSSLSSRELDVTRLVAQGWTNQEVARELFITEHTVKAHLRKILSKLGLDNRVQVATFALDNGLLATARTPSSSQDGRAARHPMV